MRRIALWAVGTVVVVVLLFSYRTSTSGTSATAPSGGVREVQVGEGAATQTYAGRVVSVRYGNVQVQITLSGGKLTEATALQLPNANPRNVEINGQAVPILNRAAVDAQSADIDMVSGATVTSTAYLESLQSALDQAHL